jgi:hypothetical protein
MKLGIDIGRVLIAPDTQNSKPDTSFIGGSMTDALATPPYEGMFDVVPSLVQKFDGKVWLISKAGPRMQDKTRCWLRHHNFYARTGINEDNLRFCLERPQKADHCEALGITHFIDDRTDVLHHLKHVVASRYLFGPQRQNTVVPHGLIEVLTWPDVAKAFAKNFDGNVR